MKIMLEGIELTHALQYVSDEEKKRLSLGRWETEDAVLLRKHLSRNDSVLELGACIGFISSFTNKLIDGKHVILEPNIELIPCLEETRKVNNCDFEILNKIVSDKEQEEFDVNDFRLGSRCLKKLNQKKFHPLEKNYRKTQVQGIKMRELCDMHDFTFLFCDIEGSEYELIKNNLKEIESFDKLIFEFHYRFNTTTCNERIHKECLELLKSKFSLVEKIRSTYYFERKGK